MKEINCPNCNQRIKIIGTIGYDLYRENLLKKEQEIERLKDDNKYLNKVNIELSSEKNRLKSIIKEVREYIKENQEEHKYIDRGGFTYTEGHFLRDSDTLLEILDKVGDEK